MYALLKSKLHKMVSELKDHALTTALIVHVKEVQLARLRATLWVSIYLRLKLFCLGSNFFHCQAALQGLQLCRTMQAPIYRADQNWHKAHFHPCRVFQHLAKYQLRIQKLSPRSAQNERPQETLLS